MLRTFLYGELAYMPNLEMVLDEHITDDDIVSASLDDYTINRASGGRILAVKSTLSCVNGLVLSLDPEQIKILMAYYGKDFRLTNVTVKNGLSEIEVKAFLYIGDGNLYKPEYCTSIDSYIQTFCYTHISDESELQICDKTLAGLFPDYNVEWLKNQFPAYVKWMREVCYAKEFMFDSISGAETPERYMLEIVEYLYTIEIGDSRDLCIDGMVPHKMPLSEAVEINSYWKFLSSESKDPAQLLKQLSEAHNLDTETYDKASHILDEIQTGFSEAIKALEDVWSDLDDVTKHSLLFCILKCFDLPLVLIKSDTVKPLEPCVCNNLYLRYLR